MTELKSLCIYFSLTLLLSLAVEGALKTDQKWSVGDRFGYEGGFCFPGLCIEGSAGSRFNFGRGGATPYRGGNGYRQTLYCKPLTCWRGSCEAVHLHLDKKLYESLVCKNKNYDLKERVYLGRDVKAAGTEGAALTWWRKATEQRTEEMRAKKPNPIIRDKPATIRSITI